MRDLLLGPMRAFDALRGDLTGRKRERGSGGSSALLSEPLHESAWCLGLRCGQAFMWYAASSRTRRLGLSFLTVRPALGNEALQARRMAGVRRAQQELPAEGRIFRTAEPLVLLGPLRSYSRGQRAGREASKASSWEGCCWSFNGHNNGAKLRGHRRSSWCWPEMRCDPDSQLSRRTTNGQGTSELRLLAR